MNAGFLPPLQERPAVTVDVVIFSLVEDDLKLLLVRRDRPPFQGRWGIPGGFVYPDESLENAAARKLAEETGVKDVYLEQLYTFGNPQRDPRARVITVAYFALLPYSIIRELDANARWFSMKRLPEQAFDHGEIAQYALTRLRYKLEYTTVGFQLLPDVFTLSELQKAYEIILDEKLDKRNFRRKILAADILEDTGKMKRDGEGRPAKLYRYLDNAITEVKTRRLFP